MTSVYCCSTLNYPPFVGLIMRIKPLDKKTIGTLSALLNKQLDNGIKVHKTTEAFNILYIENENIILYYSKLYHFKIKILFLIIHVCYTIWFMYMHINLLINLLSYNWTCEEQPPAKSNHFWDFPWVVALCRFDCIFNGSTMSFYIFVACGYKNSFIVSVHNVHVYLCQWTTVGV